MGKVRKHMNIIASKQFVIIVCAATDICHREQIIYQQIQKIDQLIYQVFDKVETRKPTS